MKSLSNKKAISLNTELIVAVIAILIIAVVGILSANYTSNAKKQLYNVSPELTYQFPAVFTYSFLMTPITNDEKKKLNLIETQDYFVKDLVMMETDDAKDIIEAKRKDYIEKYEDEAYKTPLYYYKEFSGNKINNPEKKLLCIFYDKQFSESLDEAIIRDNYFFYTKTYKGEYALVKFYCGS